MQIFVFIEGSPDPQAIVVAANASPGTIREALGTSAPPADARVWREGTETPLAEDVSAGFRENEVLHVSRCHRVATTVNYLRRSETKDFPPSVTLRAVLEWAESTFHVEGAERSTLALALCGHPTDHLSLRTHLGSISVACKACFDLVPVRKTEG